jgi:hypothetical protein
MITEKDLRGITQGPISINDFLSNPWTTLYLPNGDQNDYALPEKQDFFDKPQYRNGRGWSEGSRGSFADLRVIRKIIAKWNEKASPAIIEAILAILVFGSSVRMPNKIKVQKGCWFWKRQVDDLEHINPKDIDVLVITADNVTSDKICYLDSRRQGYAVGDGSCSWIHVMTTMGFDINSMTISEYTTLLGNSNHECQVPNNVRKEGVLIAVDSDCPDITLELQSPRKVVWTEDRRSCHII